MNDKNGMSDMERMTINAMMMTTLEEQDKMLEEMWDAFGDVRYNPDTETIEEPFLEFDAGTDRETIWNWFDQRHSKGIVYLLYGDTYIQEGRNLARQLAACEECETGDCAYNHNGICRYSLVHGVAPTITETDGCLSGVLDVFHS